MYREHLLIHSSVDGHLGCFHLSAVVNNITMNMDVQESIRIPAFSSLGNIPRSTITGSYGNSMFNLFWGAAILLCDSEAGWDPETTSPISRSSRLFITFQQEEPKKMRNWKVRTEREQRKHQIQKENQRNPVLPFPRPLTLTNLYPLGPQFSHL